MTEAKLVDQPISRVDLLLNQGRIASEYAVAAKFKAKEAYAKLLDAKLTPPQIVAVLAVLENSFALDSESLAKATEGPHWRISFRPAELGPIQEWGFTLVAAIQDLLPKEEE